MIDENWKVKLDETDSNYTYVGKAARGAVTTATVWQIMRVSSASAVDWISGSDRFEFRWDTHSSGTYS